MLKPAILGKKEVREKRTNLPDAKIGSPKQASRWQLSTVFGGQTLAELKAQYQDAYLAAHAAARFGANDDKQKAALDERIRGSRNYRS